MEKPGAHEILIGLGTGRCGTQSFAALMAQQPGVCQAAHERVFLPWLGTSDHVWRDRAVDLLRVEGPGLNCEVASWYLPYAEHLRETARESGRELRFLILQRTEDEVVASFLRKTGPERNHWQPHEGEFDAYDACFPQFPAGIKKSRR